MNFTIDENGRPRPDRRPEESVAHKPECARFGAGAAFRNARNDKSCTCGAVELIGKLGPLGFYGRRRADDDPLLVELREYKDARRRLLLAVSEAFHVEAALRQLTRLLAWASKGR